jgi:hypothetical protein
LSRSRDRRGSLRRQSRFDLAAAADVANLSCGRLFIGITDQDWFEALAAAAPDEVNFWQPSGHTTFRALQPGELFYSSFMRRLNFIVGGGCSPTHHSCPSR